MKQADRDRLVTLRKTKKRLITQTQAAEELGVSERQVKRLRYALKKRGDKAVVTGCGEAIEPADREDGRRGSHADPVGGFVHKDAGPLCPRSIWRDKHDIEVSKET